MKWMQSGLMILWLCNGASVHAQESGFDVFADAASLSGKGSAIRGSYFMAIVGDEEPTGLFASGSRYSGLPLGSQAMHGWIKTKEQGVGVRIQRTGFPSWMAADVMGYYGRKLSEKISLAAGVGLQSLHAKGYGAQYDVNEGLGIGIQLTAQCRWVLQAEGLHHFFLPGQPGNYQIRTGMGFRCGEAVSLTLEYYFATANTQGLSLVCHYQPIGQALFRFGLVNRQFFASGGWKIGRSWLELGLGWHAALGLQQQLLVSVNWEKERK